MHRNTPLYHDWCLNKFNTGLHQLDREFPACSSVSYHTVSNHVVRDPLLSRSLALNWYHPRPNLGGCDYVTMWWATHEPHTYRTQSARPVHTAKLHKATTCFTLSRLRRTPEFDPGISRLTFELIRNGLRHVCVFLIVSTLCELFSVKLLVVTFVWPYTMMEQNSRGLSAEVKSCMWNWVSCEWIGS